VQLILNLLSICDPKKQFRGHTVLQTSHTILSLSARYQQDFDTGMSIAAAERFYQQALMLFPEMGLYFVLFKV